MRGSSLAKSFLMDFAASYCSPREIVAPTTTKQVVKKSHFQILIGKFRRANHAITISLCRQHSSRSASPVVTSSKYMACLAGRTGVPRASLTGASNAVFITSWKCAGAALNPHCIRSVTNKPSCVTNPVYVWYSFGTRTFWNPDQISTAVMYVHP